MAALTWDGADGYILKDGEFWVAVYHGHIIRRSESKQEAEEALAYVRELARQKGK